MPKKSVLSILFVLLCIPAANASSVADRVQSKYESLASLEAEFVQILTNAATEEQDKRTGRIYYSEPELIRWVTESPEKEVLIVGPKTVWDYFPEEDTAYKYPVREILSSKTMLRFISGRANLKEDFKIEDQGREDGLAKLKLVPHEPETNLVLAYIWVDEENWLVKKVLVVDFWGNGNELRLSGISLNPDLDDGLFEFSPPEDVLIQDNTKNGSDQSSAGGGQ
ncbi:MAG: outer membrane lipoprotein chaperone LolA [Desulfonatronovibrionaceae bacterium]